MGLFVRSLFVCWLFVGCFVCLFVCLVGWLVGWLLSFARDKTHLSQFRRWWVSKPELLVFQARQKMRQTQKVLFSVYLMGQDLGLASLFWAKGGETKGFLAHGFLVRRPSLVVTQINPLAVP